MEIKQGNEKHLVYYSESVRKIVSIKVGKKIIKKQNILVTLKNEIESAINAGDQDSRENSSLRKLSLFSNSTQSLTLDDALRYFGKHSFNKIQEKRSLSPKSLSSLKTQVLKYLIEGTESKNWCAPDKLKEIDACNDEENKKPLIVQLGKMVAQKRCYNPEQFPEILLFEYKENKLIYEIQYRTILKFLEKNEQGMYCSKVIQVLMGLGKTTILPLIARLQFKGTNLTVVEVPAERLKPMFIIFP